MRVQRLSTSELVAVVGGALLLVGLFLPWYGLSDNPNAVLAGSMDGPFTGWEVHTTLRWALLPAAAAPLILAYVILRNHELSWARGELTAVVAIAAFGLVAYNGLIDRPGSPASEIGLQWGYLVALGGTLLAMGGSVLRSAESGRRRKPPGVL
jgi:hypothetical protein